MWKKYIIPWVYNWTCIIHMLLCIHCDVLVLLMQCFMFTKLSNRYFIIIDDIWSKQAWREIQCAFPNSNASRIMTTTRIQDVANCCCFPYKNYVYTMKPLDSGDSRRLFLETIFDHRCLSSWIARSYCDDILRKCEGLPLT